ncbi:MAG: DUF3459 domain-containing protein [Alphaproteobacteria bacterium]|nr:DUF3459 domain-containing protein [Alphaproteobacteria bacterium]
MSDWRHGAVIYQIYPRSFCDANGDGIGDLKGVLEKLAYVAELGVDGVWLSPFFASPMKDYGYDVLDYRAVDPLFGAMSDFDAVVSEAHRLGLKIIIDQVYSHTSDAHAWFTESRKDRVNAKADWYVWADAKPDGSPPNNWQALFGGPSWEWDARRRQYYLHNFLREQPDLNVRNLEVQEALLETARFWLDRGVDGFRLDVANFYIQDARLRDNPARDVRGTPKRPHEFQHHVHDRSQPETLAFMERLRTLLDAYPDRFSVGEIEDEDALARQLEYCAGGNRLHSAYSFYLLRARALTPDLIRSAHAGWDDAWPGWSFSNHDVPRAATRLAGDDCLRAQQAVALLLCLRGVIFLYQGEELGLPQADVPFERLRDPEAIQFWPHGIGRDGARTPMPWTADGGFSENAETWLPMDPRHLTLNASGQQADPTSTLSLTRRLLRIRREIAALRTGGFSDAGSTETLLAFRRTVDDQTVLCVFNLSDSADTLAVPASSGLRMERLTGEARLEGQALQLGPWSSALLI